MELFLVLGALVTGGMVGGVGVGIITGSFATRSCDICGRAIGSAPHDIRPISKPRARTLPS
jgi:hypothetical protein